jgi:5-hydroxyisourate hydrolase
MARLTTHVLDTTRGAPAVGVVIELYLLVGDERRPLATQVTNADGRTAEPLLATDSLETGLYEMVFRVTDYFRLGTASLTSPPFLGDIVVRFGIADPTANYHVPLLVSPYGYTTYRGS